MDLETMKSYINSIAPTIYESLKNDTLTVITGCTKLKIWDTKYGKDEDKSLPAERVYMGPLFKQFNNFKTICSKYNINLRWKILSAKYGIIDPEYYISDYNVSFVSKYNTTTNAFVKDRDIFYMIENLFVTDTKFNNTKNLLIWAGKEYVSRIQNALDKVKNTNTQTKNIKVFAPAYGLKIGESLQMMKNFNIHIEKLMEADVR